jgi:hypothetical protein
VHIVMSFLEKWRSMMKAIKKAKVEELVAAVLKQTKEFTPLMSHLFDVGFI